MLDPRLAVWLNRYNLKVARSRARGVRLTLESVRQGMEILSRTMAGTPVAGILTEDREVTGSDRVVPVRIYMPDCCQRDLSPLLFLHGGGHCTGSIASHDSICRRLALATQHLVVSVEYRLAPEHPFPAGLKDCALVATALPELLHDMPVDWQAGIRMAGDSAGGSLVLHLMTQKDETLLNSCAKLVLLYPGLDYSLEYAMRSRYSSGYLLDVEHLRWYKDQLFQGSSQDRNAVSPLRQSFPSLPETFLLTCGFCPLAEEGELFAQVLREGGVSLIHHHEPTMIHAFLGLHELVADVCEATYARIAAFLNDRIPAK